MCNSKQSNKRYWPWCKSAVAKIDNPTNATFKITDTKLYVPVVILSTEDDNELLDH